jgi:hypothetical protein
MSLKYLETIGDILIIELRIQIRETDALETYLRISSYAENFLQYLLVGTEDILIVEPRIHIRGTEVLQTHPSTTYPRMLRNL